MRLDDDVDRLVDGDELFDDVDFDAVFSGEVFLAEVFLFVAFLVAAFFDVDFSAAAFFAGAFFVAFFAVALLDFFDDAEARFAFVEPDFFAAFFGDDAEARAAATALLSISGRP